MQLNLYMGKVISASDPDEKGKIQIRAYPMMKDVADADCMWMRPFLATATGEYSFNPPAINSIVWVIDFDNFVHNTFYLPYSTLDGIMNISSDFSKLQAVSDLDIGSVANVAMHSTEDGTIVFRNKSNGAIGILHNTGAYVFINPSGSVILNSKAGDKIEMDGSGDISVSGNVTFKGGTLKTSAGSAGNLTGDGGFLGTKVCLISGAPICGSQITCP